jgi:hypothetical protein
MYPGIWGGVRFIAAQAQLNAIGQIIARTPDLQSLLNGQ